MFCFDIYYLSSVILWLTQEPPVNMIICPRMGQHHHLRHMESLRITRPHPMPVSLIQMSWPRTISRNITTDPPTVVTVPWKGRLQRGKMKTHISNFSNLLKLYVYSVSQAQAPLRSSRVFSVYLDSDDRDRQSVSRFSAVPESRSYRSDNLISSNVLCWI